MGYRTLQAGEWHDKAGGCCGMVVEGLTREEHAVTSTRRTRLNRLVLTTALVTMVVALAPPAGAAAPTRVDFTIAEALPVSTPGTLIAGSVPNCTVTTVDTPTATATTVGSVTVFEGTKQVNCDEGHHFTMSFSARVAGCASFDTGTWRLEGGTGPFAGATGSGRLIGTYVGGDGTACDSTGINDRYTGKIRFS